MLKLVFQYIRYYKKQTFAILSSVFLTSVLITGIGSLMFSNEMNDLENKRTMYGDIISRKQKVSLLKDFLSIPTRQLILVLRIYIRFHMMKVLISHCLISPCLLILNFQQTSALRISIAILNQMRSC